MIPSTCTETPKLYTAVSCLQTITNDVNIIVRDFRMPHELHQFTKIITYIWNEITFLKILYQQIWHLFFLNCTELIALHDLLTSGDGCLWFCPFKFNLKHELLGVITPFKARISAKSLSSIQFIKIANCQSQQPQIFVLEFSGIDCGYSGVQILVTALSVCVLRINISFNKYGQMTGP